MVDREIEIMERGLQLIRAIFRRKPAAGLWVACMLSVCITMAGGQDYSRSSVTQLIDQLTQVDSPVLGIDSAAIYKGFIADDTPSDFTVGVLGVAPPQVPPQMRELVRRGPLALPELVRHLDDRRPTKLEVGNKDSGSTHQVGVDIFMFSFFSDEYDPRSTDWYGESEEERRSRFQPMKKDFKGRYAVKVGDVCYVLIGQIVSRDLVAVRYQPSGGLVVNSPVEISALAGRVRNDWGKADASTLKASLLADIHPTSPKLISEASYTRRFIHPALERLRLYFPDTYNALEGDDLKKKKEFEDQEARRRLAK